MHDVGCITHILLINVEEFNEQVIAEIIGARFIIILIIITIAKTDVYWKKSFSFLEHKRVLDFKEEPEDVAICKPDEGFGGGSPGVSESGKRSSSEAGSHTNKSTRTKRVKVSAEVRCVWLCLKS